MFTFSAICNCRRIYLHVCIVVKKFVITKSSCNFPNDFWAPAMNLTLQSKILLYQYVAIIPHENECAIIQFLPLLQSNSQCFDNFQPQGRALHSESNLKNILVSLPGDMWQKYRAFLRLLISRPLHKVTLKPTYVKKTQQVSANETAKINFIGLRLYLSFLSKSDLIRSALLSTCLGAMRFNQTSAQSRQVTCQAKATARKYQIFRQATTVWSSCSSSTCETSLTGNRQTRATHAHTHAT